MIVANRLKHQYPYLKIYGRVHDKNHNFPFDYKDRKFYSGFQRTGLHLFIDWFGKKILFKLKYSKWISNFDKVFTVSNYSLQLLKDKRVKFINYYYQGVLNHFKIIDHPYKDKYKKAKYILFVNGGRPEKNCIRALEAFMQYKEKNNNDIKLFITSITEQTKTNILKSFKKKDMDYLKDVEFYGYIPYEELQCLYENSQFLLFASKGEGFGLPVLESILCNRPVVASWSTSIPEVAGSAVYYVNPLDTEAIANGIEYMLNDKNLKFYEEAIKRKREIILNQIAEDEYMLLHDLFE